jgi:hypothetical protein
MLSNDRNRFVTRTDGVTGKRFSTRSVRQIRDSTIELLGDVFYPVRAGVIFDRRITCRLHIELIGAKAFRTFIRIYSLLKSERLSANVKLTLNTALISNDLSLPRLGSSGTHLSLKIAGSVKQGYS